MEKIVNFRDRQELQAADLSNTQTFAQDSLDHVVADAVTTGSAYTGFQVSQSSATNIDVTLGRLYAGGKVFCSDAALSLSLFQYLPTASSKVVTVAVSGSEVDVDLQPRDFLTDLTTGATQPSSVAMTHERQAQVNLVPGVESGTPQPPTLTAGLVPVAYVTLATTGITAVKAESSTLLPSLDDHAARMLGLEAWKSQAIPRISSIASDLTALANATTQLAPRQSLLELANDVSRLKAKANLPSTYASYSLDAFGDATASDNTQTGYACNLQNGLHFPFQASGTFNLAFLNPTDPGVYQDASGWCLPVYTLTSRIQATGRSGDISISQYQVQTTTIQAVQSTVVEAHAGWQWTYQPNWYANYYYRYYPYYYRYGIYQGTVPGDYVTPTYSLAPSAYTYYTTRTETSYVPMTTTTSITGAMVAETFLVANSMWCPQIGLNFSSVAATGDVTVLLVKCKGGRPDMKSVLANVTVPVANLKVCDQAGETAVPIPPVLLEGGNRYAIVVSSQGNHRLCTVDGNNFLQGDLLSSTNGEFLVADLTKDLMFTVYACQFTANRTATSLNPLQLTGGLTDIHSKFTQVIPKGTDLFIEVQIGGIWYQMGDSACPLNTQPSLVPARLVSVATTDLAPAWKLDAAALTASRPDVSLCHWSTLRTLAASTTQVTVQAVVSCWDAVNHALSCTLMNGATPVSPSTTTSKTDPDGQQRITWVFASLPSISSYRLKLTGTRGAGSRPFVVTERMDCAL